MNFSTQQLPSGKWGIYCESRLLAVTSCQEICQTILSNLANGRRDTPLNDVNELYVAPTLRNQSASSSPAPRLGRSLPSQSLSGQSVSEGLMVKAPKDNKLKTSMPGKQKKKVSAKTQRKKSSTSGSTPLTSYSDKLTNVQTKERAVS